MEGDICRRHISRERIGCVWVFMNMFDFRHGGSNLKLLMDKKRGSKRIIGNYGMFETRIENQETEAEMHSMKQLIEDEIDEKIKLKYDFDCRGGTKARTCSKTSDDDDINVLITDDHADDHYPKISQNEVDLLHDDSEEKFSELIKRLIAQRESEMKSFKNLQEKAFMNSGMPNSKDPQRIVVLKPESSSLLDLGSSPGLESPDNKTKSGRFGSSFLSKIRRLKSTIVRNPCNFQHCSVPDPDSCSGEEDIEIKSDSDIANKVTKEDSIQENEDSKKSMSGIYIIAKKHLSEMLAEGDIDVDLPDKKVPRTLGKILALSEFSTPTSSPRITLPDTSDMPDTKKEEKEEEEEKTVMNSSCEATSTSSIQQDEYKQPLEKEPFDERLSSCSPPNSSVRMSECQENVTDVPGKSSPVSVLEPLFTDDDLSPNSSSHSSVKMRMQPRCLRFDGFDDKELALAYIQAVIKSSNLSWEELLARSFYSDKLLEQALMEDIDFCSTKLCNDKKLLFDCINEVLMEICGHGPWISLVKPEVRFENVVEVVQEEVYWHLLPLDFPYTLDQIVRKDLARSGRWMDLRVDIGCIGSETCEMILDDVLEEIITGNFTDLVLNAKL